MGAALVLIFVIVTAMLRSPVAGLVVVGTVAASYASALGMSVLVWQQLLDHDLHWAVAPIAFIALIAVGADYNLLLALRIKQEAQAPDAGIRTGIIRAFGGTGGVVTTAGIVFGITMLALLGSSVLSIAQIGTTIAVGPAGHPRRAGAHHTVRRGVTQPVVLVAARKGPRRYPRVTLPALMQDAQTFSRFLLPPGRVTTCTVWTFGFHRRLVRRWECDTDLPKPGPFPQISHTAAIIKLLKGLGGPATRASGSRDSPGLPGPAQDTDCRGQLPKRALTHQRAA